MACFRRYVGAWGKRAQFHEELAEYIDENRISRICLFGPRMEWLYHRLAPKFSGRLFTRKMITGKSLSISNNMQMKIR